MRGDLLILTGADVEAALAGRDRQAMAAVREAYLAHARGRTSLPHSAFLRFPDDGRNRIIALPAYLDAERPIAGVKWIASFPGNHAYGIDRASAAVILNSTVTGRPEALLEGAEISAVRTAASAALAAQALHADPGVDSLSLIGCGRINFTILRFLLPLFPRLANIYLFDLDQRRAQNFAGVYRQRYDSPRVEALDDMSEALSASPLISFATTASTPHVHDLAACPAGSTVLHISLRDLAPEIILDSDNVVDDADHVCRAQTSVHLAESLAGNRDFIRASLADVLLGRSPARMPGGRPVVFSPFGLGILDLAVADLVTAHAREQRLGLSAAFFQPSPFEAAASLEKDILSA